MTADIACDAPGGGAALLRIKAVPGARRDEVAGRLGDRLKIRISAPPEDGKANRAICALLAKELGVKPRDVSIIAGHSSAEKTARIEGAGADTINEMWQLGTSTKHSKKQSEPRA